MYGYFNNVNKLKPTNKIEISLNGLSEREQLNLCSGSGYLGDLLFLGFLTNPFGIIYLLFSKFNKKKKLIKRRGLSNYNF
jgi:hypothetical protein